MIIPRFIYDEIIKMKQKEAREKALLQMVQIISSEVELSCAIFGADKISKERVKDIVNQAFNRCEGGKYKYDR